MKKKLIRLVLVLALLCAIMPSALAASIPFNDVPKDAWYRSAVEFVYENQLFYGTSDTEFSPNSSMTRGMLVSVLWRQAGLPAQRRGIRRSSSGWAMTCSLVG